MTETKLDPKEEQKYERLRNLAKDLHLPIPEHFITLEVFDRNGKLLQKHHQRSHSWTRNAYNLLACQLMQKNCDDVAFGAGKLNVKDQAGVVDSGDLPVGARAQDLDVGTSGYLVAAAGTGWGILIGSGTNAEDFEDYVLQTQIAEGTGAGQLNHAASEAHSISYADTTLTDTLVRYFNNNTVGETNVDVNEVALVGQLASPAGAAEEFLVSRDKLASTVTVPSTGQLKVTYTISLTYAE